MELRLAFRRAINGGNVEFQLDVALIFAARGLVKILVFIHQPRVVGPIYKASAGAALCNRQGIFHIEDRQIRRIEHQVLISPADPFGAAPGPRVTQTGHPDRRESGHPAGAAQSTTRSQVTLPSTRSGTTAAPASSAPAATSPSPAPRPSSTDRKGGGAGEAG